MKKVLENRATDDEKKLIRLAEELKEALKVATESDEIFKKHNTLQLSAIEDVLILSGRNRKHKAPSQEKQLMFWT